MQRLLSGRGSNQDTCGQDGLTYPDDSSKLIYKRLLRIDEVCERVGLPGFGVWSGGAGRSGWDHRRVQV
jgi:hypothetical protein